LSTGHRGRELRAGRPDDAGGFFAFTFIDSRAQLLIGFAGAVAAMALFGMLARPGGAPILGYPQFSIIMATIGLGYFLRSVVGMIWAPTTSRSKPVQQGVLRIGSLVLAYDKLSVIAATIILCALLYLSSTRPPWAPRCAPVRRTCWQPLIWAFRSSGWCDRGGDQRRGRDLRGRAAGADHVHSLQCRPGARLKAFPAAVLGGFGSIPGAVVGGVLIGVIESMAGFYLPQGWKDVAPYIVFCWCVAAQAGGPVRFHIARRSRA